MAKKILKSKKVVKKAQLGEQILKGIAFGPILGGLIGSSKKNKSTSVPNTTAVQQSGAAQATSPQTNSDKSAVARFAGGSANSDMMKKGGTLKKAKGGGMIKRADGSYSKRGLWDNIRANKGSGKKPTAAMLKQEKKIKAQTKKK